MGNAMASQARDPLERVQKTQASFAAMLNSGAPVWCRLLGPKIISLLPKTILKFILSSNRIGNGIIFTSVPGSSEKNSIKLLGQDVVSMIPMIGPQYTQTGRVHDNFGIEKQGQDNNYHAICRGCVLDLHIRWQGKLHNHREH